MYCAQVEYQIATSYENQVICVPTFSSIILKKKNCFLKQHLHYVCFYVLVHRKIGFIEVSKNLVRHEFESNYIERLRIDDNAAKNFDVLTTSLNVLNFDG